jgi:hypothetical protein
MSEYLVTWQDTSDETNICTTKIHAIDYESAELKAWEDEQAMQDGWTPIRIEELE